MNLSDNISTERKSEKKSGLFSLLLTIAPEFFSCFKDQFTYNPFANLYTIFGFAWGMPVPLVALGLVTYTLGLPLNVTSFLIVIGQNYFIWVFLFHPILFYLVFGALGTMHKRREDLIRLETQELENTKDQLIVRERMAMIGQLAAGVAHEINNPVCIMLAKIGFQKSLLTTPEAFNNQVKKDLDKFETHLLRVGDITKGLLSFARQSVGLTSLVDFPKMLTETLLFLEYEFKKNNIELIKEINLQKSQFQGCAGELQQVFLNIFSNAMDAMSSKKEGTLTVMFSEDDAEIKIIISDTGVGIPDKIRERIMEPFFSTKGIGKGTGLGLSITYGIISKHHGRINFTSTVGEGTTFVLHFPIKKTSITQ